MEYTVVYHQNEFTSTAISRLKEEVEKLQKEGWRCQGGISISCDGWGHVAQAMVRD